jgi:hypothetical protein
MSSAKMGTIAAGAEHGLCSTIEFHKRMADEFLKRFNGRQKTNDSITAHYQMVCQWHKAEQIRLEMELSKLLNKIK